MRNNTQCQFQMISNHLQWGINFANTTNDTADTYRRLKTLPQDKLNILNPTIGFHKWVTEIKKYKTPTVLMRNCCSTYKEGQIYSAYDKNQPMVQVLGLRRHESTKRAEYQYEMGADFYADLYGHRNTPAAWITVAPLIDWTDVDVWLFLLRENMDFNRQYRLGFNRCGCLVCPYQTAYVDLLIAEHYPKAWSRWVEILKKGYEQMHVAQNFKWTLEEWINGQWKEGKSKERSLLILKPTPKRVQELAQLKGISAAMAKKYWNRNCRDCNKKLTSTEVAMFFKLHGRLEEVEDDQRPMQCRKCYCAETGMKTKEYSKMVLQFVDEGCNLF